MIQMWTCGQGVKNWNRKYDQDLHTKELRSLWKNKSYKKTKGLLEPMPARYSERNMQMKNVSGSDEKEEDWDYASIYT